MAEALLREFGSEALTLIPGLYIKDGHWTIAGKAGLLIPVRNLAGLIVSIKIRAADGEEKYSSLSSKKKGGPSAGSHVHCPLGIRDSDASTVRLTEGEFKAEVATLLSGVPTISTPGVAQWKMALSVLRELNAKRVLVAFDADYRDNPQVQRSLTRCLDALVAEGYSVSQETWDPGFGKGIDDVLAGGNSPQIVASPHLLGDSGDGGDSIFRTSLSNGKDIRSRIRESDIRHRGDWFETQEALHESGLVQDIASCPKSQHRTLILELAGHLGFAEKTTEFLSLREYLREVVRENRESEEQEESGKVKVPSNIQHLQKIAVAPSRILARDGEVFVIIEDGESRGVVRSKSEKFKLWLTRSLFAMHGETVSDTALKDAVRLVEAMALDERNIHDVHLRIAKQDNGDFWYDLADPTGRAVRMTPGGWEVVWKPPVYFRQHAKTAPQVMPERGGDLNALRKFIRVSDEHDWHLLISWLVTCLIAEGPRPSIVLTGEQGSSKSTTARVLKRLLDPAVTELIPIGKDQAQLSLSARQAYVLAFDNISYIAPEVSDNLCRLVTGDSFEKRTLYTDDESVLWNIRCAVILNGITSIVTQPDLLDRSIIIRLRPFKGHERLREDDLWREFQRERGKILGCLFDLAVCALSRRTDVVEVPDCRMGDFAAWAVALEMGAGWPSGLIETALAKNVEVQTEEALEHSQTAQAIIRLVEKEGEWLGRPTELHLRLKELWASESGQLPKNSASLGREVARVTPVLRKVGISIERGRPERDTRIRQISIKGIGKMLSPLSPPSPPSTERDEVRPDPRPQSAHSKAATSRPAPPPKPEDYGEEEF
jgi:hypothetical protein